MNFNVSCPINSVSFGLVSYNILKEFYSRGLSPHIFPIGGVDLSSFDKISQDMALWLQSCINKAPRTYKKDFPEWKLWHINGSETSHSAKQVLTTFFETDQISEFESNILNNQAATLISSNYTKKVFEDHGVNNVKFCPLGFDTENFKRLEHKHPYDKQCIVFLLAGKWEKRKGTEKLLKLWVSRYGNNPKYKLHLHSYNSFLSPDPNQCAQLNQQLIQQAFGGKVYWNVNIINTHLRTLSEYNQLINSCDICIDGSSNENWSLPAFHAAGIGKHLVAVKANGIADWATDENAAILSPVGKEKAADGRFFHENSPFNGGNFMVWDENDYIAAMEAAEKRYLANPINEPGLKLQKDFAWSRMADVILENLK